MTDNTTPVKEIKIPVADPNDPYAIPAAMPSSVDHAVRSFNAGDYPEPSRKQDEWRYTPIERINEFFTVFKPSGETQIEVSMIDGSPLAEGVKLSQIKLGEDTYPHVDVREDDVSMAHEATVSKISEDQLFYLMSRGLTEEEARGMIVRGFVEPISRELPMEYALELNRLVELQMEGSVG